MARAVSTSWAFVFAVLAGVALAPSYAAEVSAAKKGNEEQSASPLGLPAEVATKHVITLAGEKLAFTARAGAWCVSSDAQSGAPRADVAFVTYERADARSADAAYRLRLQRRARRGLRVAGARRAVALAASPRWRQLFAIDAAARRRQRRKLARLRRSRVRDPPVAGYSKFLNENEELKKHFFSAQGDVEALAVVVRKWLTTHRRLASPKYLVGESYGGFRVVKLAGALRERENVGVEGLVLVSPVLDFSWLDGGRNILTFAAYLPSFAAISRGAKLSM